MLDKRAKVTQEFRRAKERVCQLDCRALEGSAVEGASETRNWNPPPFLMPTSDMRTTAMSNFAGRSMSQEAIGSNCWDVIASTHAITSPPHRPAFRRRQTARWS